MAPESKKCPSCKEKNNPAFAKCWKCGTYLSDEGLATQQSQTINVTTGRHERVELVSRSYFKKGMILQWIGSLISVSIFFVSKHKLVIFLSGVIIFAVGWFLEIASRGNAVFWTKIKDYPDMAYDWFKTNPSWTVLDESVRGVENLFDKREWVGPFHLAVPKLGGKTVKIMGRRRDLYQSELELLGKIEAVEN